MQPELRAGPADRGPGASTLAQPGKCAPAAAAHEYSIVHETPPSSSTTCPQRCTPLRIPRVAARKSLLGNHELAKFCPGGPSSLKVDRERPAGRACQTPCGSS